MHVIAHTVTGDKLVKVIEHVGNGGTFKLRGKRWKCTGYSFSTECVGGDRVASALRNEDLRIANPAAYHAEVDIAKSRAVYTEKAKLELVLID